MKRLCGRMSYFASLAVSAGGTQRESVLVERFLGVVGYGSGSGLWDFRTALVLLKHTYKTAMESEKGWRHLKTQLKPSYTWTKLLYFICMSYNINAVLGSN